MTVPDMDIPTIEHCKEPRMALFQPASGQSLGPRLVQALQTLGELISDSSY